MTENTSTIRPGQPSWRACFVCAQDCTISRVRRWRDERVFGYGEARRVGRKHSGHRRPQALALLKQRPLVGDTHGGNDTRSPTERGGVQSLSHFRGWCRSRPGRPISQLVSSRKLKAILPEPPSLARPIWRAMGGGVEMAAILLVNQSERAAVAHVMPRHRPPP